MAKTMADFSTKGHRVTVTAKPRCLYLQLPSKPQDQSQSDVQRNGGNAGLPVSRRVTRSSSMDFFTNNHWERLDSIDIGLL